MTSRQVTVLLLTLISITLALLAFDIAAAEPPALAPTEEPTKRPYVFPTPIFIPTYPTEVPIGTAVPSRPSGTIQAPASSQHSGGNSYTVQPGDNPWTIAQKACGNGVKSTLILAENSISDPTKLRVGTVLKIPAECSGSTSAQTTMAMPQPTALPVSTSVPVSFSMPVTTPATSARSNPSSFGSPADVLWQLAMLFVNVGSGLLMLGSIVSGGSALMVYRRGRFLRAVTIRVQRLRARHK